MSRLPPLAWLQGFEAAARTLNFTLAGKELSVSQSAISRRIKLLEAHLGQKLFVRHPRSLTLTEAGRAWLPSMQDAFNRLARGTQEVFGPEPDAPVTIRATPAIQQFWLAWRLQALRLDHPDISLHIITGVWPQDFNGEDVDIEIRYGEGNWPNLVQESLGDESMTPACPPALAGDLGEPADLAGHTLIHATGFAVGWPAWLAAAGAEAIESKTRHLWCDTQVMALRLSAAGCGIALAHHRLLSGDNTLVPALDFECPTDERFWLTRPARRSLRDPAHLVWRYLSIETNYHGVHKFDAMGFE